MTSSAELLCTILLAVLLAPCYPRRRRFLIIVDSTHEELVRRNGVLPDTLTRRVIDCVGDGSRRPSNPDLSNASRSYWIELEIGYADDADIQNSYIGVHRHVVLSKARIDDPSSRGVDARDHLGKYRERFVARDDWRSRKSRSECFARE
jgi:hypothetical protein